MKRYAALVAATLAGVVFGIGTPAGQAARESDAKTTGPATVSGVSTKPFSRLFAQQVRQADAALRLKTMQLDLAPKKMERDFSRPNSARRFPCGNTMVVVEPDAAIDPRFELPLPDTKTQFAIRSTAPPSCR